MSTDYEEGSLQAQDTTWLIIRPRLTPRLRDLNIIGLFWGKNVPQGDQSWTDCGPDARAFSAKGALLEEGNHFWVADILKIRLAVIIWVSGCNR